MKRLIVLLGLVLPLGAADREHFDATCLVIRGVAATMADCHLDNMPSDGYWNRWQIKLRIDEKANVSWLLTPQIADYVRGEVTLGGSLMHHSVLWGLLQVTPKEPELLDIYKTRAALPEPFEIRPQRIAVWKDGQQVIVEFSEPKGDTDGYKKTTKRWKRLYCKSRELVGGLKKQQGVQ